MPRWFPTRELLIPVKQKESRHELSLGNGHPFVGVVEQKKAATDFLRCLEGTGEAKKKRKGEERVRVLSLSLAGGWRMEEKKSKRKLPSESLRMSKKGFRHRSCRCCQDGGISTRYLFRKHHKYKVRRVRKMEVVRHFLS